MLCNYNYILLTLCGVLTGFINVAYCIDNSVIFTEFIKIAPSQSARGIGSGLAFEQQLNSGDFYLLSISDRGPNIEGPKFKFPQKKRQVKNNKFKLKKLETKIFPEPEYIPKIYRIKVSLAQKTATVVKSTEISDLNGSKYHGLPPTYSLKHPEVALNSSLLAIKSKQAGIDPEGIDFSPKGDLWICDEYGPSIYRIDPDNGKVITELSPASGLPAILHHRRANRGFEGITVTPNGKVFAVVQSSLNYDSTKFVNKTTFRNDENSVVRLISYNPVSKLVNEYYLAIPKQFSKDYEEFKIGDIKAINNNEFIILSTWNDKVEIRKFKLSSDIITTSVLVDLRAEGWNYKKAEGLVLLSDKKTLIVINDDDFQVSAKIAFDLEKGTIEDNKYKIKIKPHRNIVEVTKDNSQETNLFIVRLKNEIG
jgi:hypothetical protein